MAGYMIQGETLTNIADAIREKAGITSPLFPESMPSYIRNIQTASSDTTDVPDDIVAEAERVASGMISKMGANSLTFIAMSDMHEYADEDNSSADVLERGRRANRNAGQAAKLISDKVKLDFYANLGDLATGGSATTVAGGVQSIRQVREYIADVVADNESFLTPGNHDSLAYSYSTTGECLSYGVLEGLIGTYRYVDFDSKKVRVICLNTSDNNGSVTAKERISVAQLQWFCETLDLSAKSDAASWGIIVLSHHPLDWGNIKPAANCLAAYLEGTVYSATHDGMTVSYDYTGKNAATFIANFHGHVHCFKTGYISGTEALRIAIPNACFARTNEYGEAGNTEFGETTSYEKVDNGTGKNTSFCVVSIDLDKQIIYADCFGAGYDRVISYGEQEIATYSVTNDLTNASNSNGTATITEGASYSAAISANDGYELDTITVTMGGEDITSTAVSGSNITIASVTGDIVITVTTVHTEVQPSYTNLVPTSIDTDGSIYNGVGYQEGYRLNSSGVPAELAGAVHSGFIPYDGELIRVWGTTNASFGTSGNYIGLYDANFAKIYVLGGSNYTAYGGTWTVKDGKYMATFGPGVCTNAATSEYLASAKYIRVSMPNCTGANLVVTLDEEIT